MEKKQIAKKADEKKREEERNGRKVLTGREIILNKFADKFYTEEDNTDQGTEWDLSEFRKNLPETEDSFKDYGDGIVDFEKKPNQE